MSRNTAASYTAIFLGALILSVPFAWRFAAPESSGVTTGPVLLFGGPVLLAGVFSLMERCFSRRQRIGLMLLAAACLVSALSLNAFTPLMTMNDYIPWGLFAAAILASLGLLSLTGGIRGVRSRQR